MASVVNVSKDNFHEEVLACDRPVLVDFYADGCGPCEFIAPILDELAGEHGDQLKFTKFYVSMDEVLNNSNEVVEKYEVMGFPTLLIFKGGKVAQSHLGAMNREELLAFVEAALETA
ncbi:co-chaperone YbbN [Sporosarcina sp. Te-1]|uniref:thioredoxin family protein n=1 Tax=Sporosarcina sp. Te-1 TaxID=2818390 RepID=UPI001A9D7401|nr:thioredoxin domain-containing protein [Sporosarcina sp. Te-1]QTD40840.1 thioredoxin [Sporosarcina sp. Te-1]